MSDTGPTIVDVQRRISEVLELAMGLRVVSFDKLEGIDSLRPCFIVDAIMNAHGVEMKYWATNEVGVDIYYYGTSTADCKAMAARLDTLFDNPLKIDPIVVVPDAHEAYTATEYVLTFSMTLSFLTYVDMSDLDVTLGHIPHWSDYASDVMGEVEMNGETIVKEDTHGSN